jgi:signal transduction histidine kinase
MQEALTNVAKHSQSKNAWVRLRKLPGAVALEVEDEGVGFGNATAGGMGLISMRERADLLHGTLQQENRSGGGARVRLTIPLDGASHG